jgi:hypothetical protein
MNKQLIALLIFLLLCNGAQATSQIIHVWWPETTVSTPRVIHSMATVTNDGNNSEDLFIIVEIINTDTHRTVSSAPWYFTVHGHDTISVWPNVIRTTSKMSGNYDCITQLYETRSGIMVSGLLQHNQITLE